MYLKNNPDGKYAKKVQLKKDELTFAQAKYDNNTVSLEGYIIDYPEGKYISEAKQLIEDIKYNHTRIKDTIGSYKKYLDEYPDGLKLAQSSKEGNNTVKVETDKDNQEKQSRESRRNTQTEADSSEGVYVGDLKDGKKTDG